MNIKKGFTLLEVMIALAIIGFVLTALTTLQISLVRGTVKSSQNLERIWKMTEFLRESQQKAENKAQRDFDDPAISVTYSRKKLGKASSLSSSKNLYIDMVQGGSKKDSLVALTFKQEKKKNEAGNKSA